VSQEREEQVSIFRCHDRCQDTQMRSLRKNRPSAGPRLAHPVERHRKSGLWHQHDHLKLEFLTKRACLKRPRLAAHERIDEVLLPLAMSPDCTCTVRPASMNSAVHNSLLLCTKSPGDIGGTSRSDDCPADSARVEDSRAIHTSACLRRRRMYKAYTAAV
jgi:hypothetical protein